MTDAIAAIESQAVAVVGFQPTMAGRLQRSYSHDTKAETMAVLDANNGNRLKTAQQTKIPRQTLSGWDDKNAIDPETRQRKKSQLADKIDEVVWQIVAAMPDKIDKAGLKDSAIAMGTGIDKANLLRGDPTQITAERGAETAQQSFARQYQQTYQCTEAEAQAAAEAAFAFTKVDDKTNNTPS